MVYVSELIKLLKMEQPYAKVIVRGPDGKRIRNVTLIAVEDRSISLFV